MNLGRTKRWGEQKAEKADIALVPLPPSQHTHFYFQSVNPVITSFQS